MTPSFWRSSQTGQDVELIGEWCLEYTNPTRSGLLPRDVVKWDVPRVLSTVIDSGANEQNPVPVTALKLIPHWLYLTPEQPPMENFFWIYAA